LHFRAFPPSPPLNSSDFIDRAASQLGERTTQFLHRHHRGITASVVLAMAGFGVTAFGIAPMAPDASDLPRRLVTEIVMPEPLEAQIEALAGHSLKLYRNDITRSNDTIDSLLQRLNISDAAAAAFLRTDPTARRLLEGRGGKMVQAQTGDSGALEELVARYPAENAGQLGTHFSRLRIRSVNGHWTAAIEVVPLDVQVRLGSGTIRSSLFASTDEAGLPEPVAVQIAEMFSTDIDFHRALRRGDTFSVIYEALTADGEPITWNQASGRVLAAEFVNDGRAHAAVWYRDPASGKGSYFGFDGQSKRRAFLASPMEFSRVTSGFEKRFHPILKTWRAHLGVDYGAPSGTQVRAVGDGVVDFAGWQNGYGNVVQIRHSNDRTTVYAHLSRIDVRQGARIEQGARVGAVGATGWATGPHLHFEVRIKGEQQDPVQMAKASEAVTVSPQAREQFSALAAGMRAQLQAATLSAASIAYAE
jgi:murein DD-endopeptidase MepM/ murein hydrolase activator NlpD